MGRTSPARWFDGTGPAGSVGQTGTVGSVGEVRKARWEGTCGVDRTGSVGRRVRPRRLSFPGPLEDGDTDGGAARPGPAPLPTPLTNGGCCQPGRRPLGWPGPAPSRLEPNLTGWCPPQSAGARRYLLESVHTGRIPFLPAETHLYRLEPAFTNGARSYWLEPVITGLANH